MSKSNPLFEPTSYRGRLAPTPSGYLHLGHAWTFLRAWARAKDHGGDLLMRIEDLDQARCRQEFEHALIEDLRWLGIDWKEGIDVGGPHHPYRQSERLEWYRSAWNQLRAAGLIYPSAHSRSDVLGALSAPHEGQGEVVFPPALRPGTEEPFPSEPGEVNWRFRVPDGRIIVFEDQNLGRQSFTAGVHFGDFLVWRKDGWPSYELAVVVDDQAMGITEVVRGEDLLLSTARQILLHEALGHPIPVWFHCPLVRDEKGQRLAKRNDALSLRSLRQAGREPRSLWPPELAQ